MDNTPFNDPERFRRVFERQLDQLLSDYDELGVYILVLANAGYDAVIWDDLHRHLEQKHAALARALDAEETGGLPVDGSPDDRSVFRKLMDLGFDNLQPTRLRGVAHWELQFNQLRAFRPARMTQERVVGISAPFDPKGFHFNRPFLRKETFWHGDLGGRECSLLYNKFPFVEMHGLLVPAPREQRPQLLTRPDHDYLWAVCEMLGRRLPGVGFGYNSYGAGASVNHLHFQMFLRSHPLPVADPGWRHNGGDETYPAHCYRFTDPAPAWDLLEQLHRREVSYNLVYLPGVLCCLPRSKQGSFDEVSWSGGFAWYEMAGGFTTFDQDEFEAIGAVQIDGALARITLEA
ncbi:MAG: hypothetical protein AB2807_11975 [Candidatus Sedimenticola endophacoides]